MRFRAPLAGRALREKERESKETGRKIDDGKDPMNEQTCQECHTGGRGMRRGACHFLILLSQDVISFFFFRRSSFYSLFLFLSVLRFEMDFEKKGKRERDREKATFFYTLNHSIVVGELI